MSGDVHVCLEKRAGQYKCRRAEWKVLEGNMRLKRASIQSASKNVEDTFLRLIFGICEWMRGRSEVEIEGAACHACHL